MRSSIVAVSAAALVVSACAVAEPTATAPSSLLSNADTRPDVELLRNTVSYTYKPFKTPNEMLDSVHVAIVGNIVSVEAVVIADELEPSGAVIVGVDPKDELKRDFGNPGDIVYYWIDRPTNLGEDVYRDALPEDTQVVLFGLEAARTSDTRFMTTTPEFVFAPVPQGLFLSAPGDPLVNVWGEEHDAGWQGLETPEEVVAEAMKES